MRIILSGGFRFVHIPFGIMVKFQFLAQFSVDHLSHPVVSLFELVYCISLLCRESFLLFHHINDTCFKVASYLFSF